jgi:hypothetical protein
MINKSQRMTMMNLQKMRPKRKTMFKVQRPQPSAPVMLLKKLKRAL